MFLRRHFHGTFREKPLAAYLELAITIQSDGIFHQIKKFKGKVIVQLMPQPSGPTCAQLSCAAWLASMAVKRDHR